MIIAADTNVLLDILVPNEQFYEVSADALQEAAGEGSLVVGDIVYAELCIHFEGQLECDPIGNREGSEPKSWRIFWSELTPKR